MIERLTTEKVETDFENCLRLLSEEELRDYCWSWGNNHLLDIMHDWETDTKLDAIKEINEIIKKR